jgi:hypothetical protein
LVASDFDVFRRIVQYVAAWRPCLYDFIPARAEVRNYDESVPIGNVVADDLAVCPYQSKMRVLERRLGSGFDLDNLQSGLRAVIESQSVGRALLDPDCLGWRVKIILLRTGYLGDYDC